MKYSDLNGLLVQRVPAIKDAVRRACSEAYGEEPGPHVLYEDVLVPHILHLLQHGHDNKQLASIFVFLEELTANGAQDIRNVVGAAVLERLNEVSQTRNAAQEFMGPATRRLFDEVRRASS